MNYCLDTNVYIESWNKYYSMRLCPQYWMILDSLAREGIIYSPIEVKHEIAKNDDDLADWINRKPYFFREIDVPVQENMRILMNGYSRLIDSIRQRSEADPWVVAFAMANGSIVVTKETPVGIQSKRYRIPDVCDEIGVTWINDFQFAEKVGIKFLASLG